MKVLVILHKDVYNIPTLHIVKEMLKRGYDIDIYAIFQDRIHLRMFDELDYVIHNIDELNKEQIAEYDFIYSAVTIEALPDGVNIDKYVFTFSTAFMDDLISYADFTFTQRDFKNYLQDYEYAIEKNNELKSRPGLVVGNPKFDVECYEKTEEKSNQILFIDAGHFPFGEKGKCEEAKMLIEMAKKYSQYKIIVKPRFLQNDKNVTHKNGIHLYSCIKNVSNNKIPSNLILLDRHVDLERLVRESSLVITPDLTTSYLDIGFYDKRGLIATNLPTEFTVSHNENHVRRFKNIELRSGLCVDYRQICEYIPNGKKCTQEHIEEMGLKLRDVSIRMVDSMEKIFFEFISKGTYPSPYEEGERISLEEVKSVRRIKKLFGIYELIKARIEELDFSPIEDKIFELWEKKKFLDEQSYEIIRNEMTEQVQHILGQSNRILMKNTMTQSYYLNALYETGKLFLENIDDYDAKEMFHCLMGKYLAMKENKYQEAIEHFKQYFKIIQNNKYERTLADSQYYIESANYWMGVSYFQIGEMSEAKRHFTICQNLTENKHQKATMYLNEIQQMEKIQ